MTLAQGATAFEVLLVEKFHHSGLVSRQVKPPITNANLPVVVRVPKVVSDRSPNRVILYICFMRLSFRGGAIIFK